MSDLEIIITNPDGSILKPVLHDQPGYDEYLDKPRRLTAKIEKGSGLDPQGTAQVVRKGKIILLGHITKFSQSKAEYDSLTLDSAEYLLDQRIGQFYRYPAGTTLNAMLSEALGGSVAGLLAKANSLVPRGSFTLHSGSIYKWVGMGTASRMGTLTSIYQGVTLLTKKTAIPTVAASWYQSATDLYVWTSDSRDPAYHLILIPNFKDTLVRLGTISLGTTTFPVCFEIGASKIFPTIKALILAAGLEWSLRYEKDGYAYLDGTVSVGRGSSSEPVATYIHGKNAEISTGEADGLGKLQALIGQGAGAGMTQQCAAAFDSVTRGTWREAIYQAGGLFGSMLRTATGKVFADYSDATIYNIRTPNQDWSQAVGNWVGVVRDGYQPVIRRIKHIQMRSAGDMLLEVGQRLRTLQELLKSGEEVQQILSSFYGAHTKNAWSWSLPETNIDSFSPTTHQFLLASTDDSIKSSDDKTIGGGEIDPNFPYMVLLNLKIDWYKTDISSVTTPSNSHSDVGSHGGYGGKETSAKTQTAHQVLQQTGVAGNPSTYIGTGVYTDLAGSHTHSQSGYGTTGATSGGGSPSHAHSYYYISGVAIYASANHQHSMGYASGVSVASNTHTHTMPGHYTQDAASQTHTGATDAANTRAGSSTHPEQLMPIDDEARFAALVAELSVGSVKFITLVVKVNNVSVPGSPFNDLYVGDSLDNIDISSLVTVGIRNSLTLTISEWGGSGVVKCAISGNVNVNAVISAF
jgi:hypothetical protein